METTDNKSNKNIFLIGCGVVFAASICCIIFSVTLVTVVFGAIKSSEPYLEGISRLQSNAAVTEALGSPVEPGFLITGSIETNNNSGTADFAIPVSGPKGSGTLYVRATKNSGTWQYTTIELSVDGGGTINLLGGR